MALYVVLHHRKDSVQPWVNSWLDDDRIEAIQTTTEIGQLCQQCATDSEPVFVHRCGSAEHDPVICCAAKVAQAAPIDRSTYLVTFTEAGQLAITPPRTPIK